MTNSPASCPSYPPPSVPLPPHHARRALSLLHRAPLPMTNIVNARDPNLDTPASRSGRSRPSWARLGEDAVEGDGSAGAAVDTGALAPTYSTPEAASAAYRAGLLVSDNNISSHHRAIRLAFRCLRGPTEEGGRPREDDGEDPPGEDAAAAAGEELFLCWIRRDGVPRHFRPLRPAAAASDDDADVATPVTERDHVENTYPGHAFVVCRRAAARDLGPVSVGDDDGAEDAGEATVVVHENERTYFLRRKRRRREKSEDPAAEGDGGGGGGEREAFLVVGGFRPGPTPSPGSDEGGGREDGAEEKGEGDMDGEQEGGDGSDDDDGSCDGSELDVQLVTIVSSTQKIDAATTHERESPDEEGDHNILSRVLRCFGCAGVAKPEPRHAPAFVATETIDPVGDATSSGPPRPAGERADRGERALTVAARVARLDPTPLDTSSKHYDAVTLGGWPCRAEPGCFPRDPDAPGTSGAHRRRARFAADLRAASASLPPHAREKLRRSTPVWINRSQSFGPRAAPVRARDGCFHPGSEWLVRNGMSPAKRGGVEWYDAEHYLSDCDLWGPGGVMLHELSHAWHCLHIEHGYDNEEIVDAYQRAMDDGLYECVGVHGPQGPRCKAYACQDQMEYFAELSVAFLGGLDEREHNKWYPHNRAQLREHDPRAFAMLCRMWGVDDDTLKLRDETPGQEEEKNETNTAG